jgi:hypothetical protein
MHPLILSSTIWLAMFVGATPCGAQDPSRVTQVSRTEDFSTHQDLGSQSASFFGASLSDPPVAPALDAGAGNWIASADASSLPAAPVPQSLRMSETYEPITAKKRLWWIVTATMGYPSLVGGVFSAAIGTGLDHPREDGPHWSGFAERYGIRLTGVATSNVMEAGLGVIWGADPRYFRKEHAPFREHLHNVVRQTFEARRADGQFAPAYARFIAITGSNFLSNTWRADSEADSAHAMLRVAEGFGAKGLRNGWEEFWPLVSARLHHAK